MDKLITTAIGVVAAIGLSGLLFIGSNKVFDVAPSRWPAFTTLLGGGAGVGIAILVWANRISHGGTQIDVPWLVIIVTIGIGLVAGYLLGVIKDRWTRLAIGAGAGAVIGLLVGLNIRTATLQFQGLRDVFLVPPPLPDLDSGLLVLWTAIGAAVGIGYWALRVRRKPVWGALVFWATVGWIVGAFGAVDIGLGTRGEAQLALTVAGGGLGAVVGLTKVPSLLERDRMAQGSRVYIFLAPSLLFIFATLVVPTARTIWLSFLDTRGEEFVGLDNYGDIFTDDTIVDVADWTNIFTSRLFIVGAIVLGIGLVVSAVLGRRTGHRLDVGPSTMTPVVFGIFLLAFAVFSTLRGTIINNLWWVFTVTLLASGLGLAIAVLADRSKRESLAKSLIFMPMAISFVGAGIIWRFMFTARDPSRGQTGVLNSLWVGLGQLSNSGTARTIVIIVTLAAAGGLLYLAYRGWVAKANGVAIGAAVMALPLFWFVYALIVGVGGFAEMENGEIIADTILFVQESPFNNFWLMVVLIWIQTGFTMVIFSAAIKAVPGELIEAAKVDGATESQTFWRVTIPQITPTIGVVVTTLIVLVMKVFDIVKVMTNGNFDSQVIANEMWQRAFTELNFGLGSALAAVLFLAVLPIMYLNIRRMQKAAV
ncbi:MAG: carbohydrate ABC transporter permease [Acidimicrobiia bacterium]